MIDFTSGIVVLTFTSDGCVPCRLQKPILAQAEAELNGFAAFHLINIAEQPELAVRYGVMNIPATVVLKDGKEHWRSIGLTEKDEIVGAVRGAL